MILNSSSCSAAQSPDSNADDHAFFRNLQSDVSFMAKESRRDLLATAVQCWQERKWNQFGCAFTPRIAEFWRVEMKPGSHKIFFYNSLVETSNHHHGRGGGGGGAGDAA